MSFKNEQVDIMEIPSVEDIEFQGLHRNYLSIELVGLSIIWFFISIGVVLNIIFNFTESAEFVPTLFGLAVLAIMITTYIITYKGFKKKKYALRDRDVVYQQGLVWRKFTVLPFNRVQHAEVHQGPIERIFDLASLKVYTAGGSSSDLSISGLEIEQAQRMKHFILNKTARDEEE